MTIQEFINQKGGRITFADFMQHALYHPKHGYYLKGRLLEEIPKKDFLTHPEITRPFFARGLANFINHAWAKMNNPSEFWLVEMGGGNGVLIKDLLDEIGTKYPKLYKILSVLLVEISPKLAYAQQQKLTIPQRQKTRWIIDDVKAAKLPKMQGVLLSNELIDAFPVNRIIYEDNKFKEIYVSLDGDRIMEISDELSHPLIQIYLDALAMHFVPDQHICVNIESIRWLRNISHALNAGYILTIDYGDLAENIYGENRSKIRTNKRFFHGTYPYKDIGQIDITSDVDFTSLITHGHKFGLEKSFFISEYQFFRNFLEAQDIEEGFEKAIDRFLTGEYKVLVQHKKTKKLSIQEK